MNNNKYYISKKDFTTKILEKVGIDTKNKSYEEKVNLWVNYIKTHNDWKEHQNHFINLEYKRVYSNIKKLSKTKEGQMKIVELYGIKNIKGCPQLLDKLQ